MKIGYIFFMQNIISYCLLIWAKEALRMNTDSTYKEITHELITLQHEHLQLLFL